MNSSAISIGIDTGGTFTDLVAVADDSGTLTIAKVPSVPGQPELGSVHALEALLAQGRYQAADIDYLVHGTTIATNAVLEGTYSRAAMVTTAGFRDVLEIGRQARESLDESGAALYDINYLKPDPLVRRAHRWTVRERTNAKGEVILEPDIDEIMGIAAAVREGGFESVAVCLINSYANPANENRVAEALSDALPDCFVCTSADVLREYREYERFSTTVLNAATSPQLKRYIANLEGRIVDLGITNPLYIMQCLGGVLPAASMHDRGVYTAYSGLVGGVLSAAEIARATNNPSLLSMDMGGTSTDIALIENSKPHMTTEGKIGPYPVRFPMVDVSTVGAGGGSLGWVDAGGLLRVGPRSAGASPGPACYGRGGTLPTVTDANVVLGRLSSSEILGGGLPIDRKAAERAIQESIATPLGLDVTAAAAGMIRVANANMLRGLRLVSIQRGKDPREFALIAFGGAGPLHASELGDELDVKSVLVPLHPGVTSALGLLFADLVWDAVETHLGRLAAPLLPGLNETLARLSHEATSQLLAQGIDAGNISLIRSLDLRYLGQGYELNVPVPSGQLRAAELETISSAFHDRHEETYSHALRDSAIEVVNARAVATGVGRQTERQLGLAPNRPNGTTSAADALIEERSVYFDNGVGWVDCSIYDRSRLYPGEELAGPCVIEQLDSTTLLLPDDRARIDEYGNLVIAKRT